MKVQNFMEPGLLGRGGEGLVKCPCASSGAGMLVT